MDCANCNHLVGSHTEDGCEVGWMFYALRDVIHLLCDKGTSVGYKPRKRGCPCRVFMTSSAPEQEPQPEPSPA